MSTDDVNSSPQLQQRLLQVTAQLDAMQSQLDRLTTISRLNSDQVAALTNGLTDPLAGEATRTQLAQLMTQLESHQDQLEALRRALSSMDQQEQEHLHQIRSLAERQDALEPVVRGTARQDQLESLAQNVASTQQIEELLETLKKLNRSQYKNNALYESKEGQLFETIKTLQAVVNRRDEIQAEQLNIEQQRRNESRTEARGEFAAELFPALDGLELALKKGNDLLEKLRSEQAQRTQEKRQNLIRILQEHKEPIDSGFWISVRQMLGGAPNADAVERNAGIDVLTQALASTDVVSEPGGVSAIESWLDGLALVRDRFLKLFASEGITPIPAEGHFFDPRVHVAVESQIRSDVEPDTVVAVLQTGYRQQRRVLRYAEVAVARAPEGTQEES